MTRKSSATDSPTTHTIRSSPSTTSGSESLISLGILRSTRKSWSFFRCPIPSGRNRSPRRRERIAKRQRNRIGGDRHLDAARRTKTAGPIERFHPVSRNRPSLIIERDLTRNRQRKPERVHPAGSPPESSRRRRPQERWRRPSASLAARVDRRPSPSGASAKPKDLVDVVEADESPVPTLRQRLAAHLATTAPDPATSARQHRSRLCRPLSLRRSYSPNRLLPAAVDRSSSTRQRRFARQHMRNIRVEFALEIRDELVPDPVSRDRHIPIARILSGHQAPLARIFTKIGRGQSR